MKILGKLIPKAVAATLLREKKTPLITGFVSQRTGKSFDASLTLGDDGKIGFLFPPRGTVEENPFPPAPPPY